MTDGADKSPLVSRRPLLSHDLLFCERGGRPLKVDRLLHSPVRTGRPPQLEAHGSLRLRIRSKLNHVRELHETVRRLGNVATRAELLRFGHRPRDVTDAVRAGRLHRLRRGHYVTVDATPAQRAAVRIGGRLACWSAASTYGLWSGTDATLHIAVPPTASRLVKTGMDAAIRFHWQGDLEESDSWRVSLADCLRGVVRCSPAESAVATLDTAITLRKLDRGSIGRIFAGEPIASRIIASRARAGSDSGVESLVRQRLQHRGLEVAQQVAVPGVGRVDMLVEGRLFLEIDGFEFHSSPHAFALDRRRDAAFVLGGLQRLRFTATDVLRDWNRVERTVLEVLGPTSGMFIKQEFV